MGKEVGKFWSMNDTLNSVRFFTSLSKFVYFS